MDIVIHTVDYDVASQPVEVVERKGIGHPDTICDALAESICVALCRYYLAEFGVILHHNVDKILLCGGAARPVFGGGEVIEPIELFLGGRVTTEFGGRRIPVDDIAVEACRQWFQIHLPLVDPERDVKFVPRFRPGSSALVNLFVSGRGGASGLGANDTSCGAGFSPLTALENAVLAIDTALCIPAAETAYPAIGADLKVMGIRHHQQVHFTIGCAMIGRHLSGIAEYVEAKSAVRRLALHAAQRYFEGSIDVIVNAADDLDAGNVYLTVTGTSAESGDDGETGRGNRVSGLITPHRPMTLEAAAGKNPVTHVGKLYNLAAMCLAGHACEFPQVLAANCVMVSEIGAPLDEPSIVELGVRLEDHADVTRATALLDSAVHRQLTKFPHLQAKLLAQDIRVY